jgi:hypothetical protein
MRRTFATTSIAILTGLVLAHTASAQESTTRGLNLGLHFSGQSLTPEDGDRANAGGAGIVAGYGFNRSLALFLQVDAGEFDVDTAVVEGTWTMGHIDLGLRYHFANSLRSWVPYLQAALSARFVNVEDGVINQVTQTEDVTTTGGALTLGGGIMFYFNETFAADIQLLGSGGRFTEVRVGNTTQSGLEVDATSGRFNLGVSWWP